MSETAFVACDVAPVSKSEPAEGATVGAAAGMGVGGDSSAVGRLVDSSQADDRRMIRLVRERRLLYARNNMPVASYHTQVKHLWLEVAREMGWSVADVRRKWSHIRNSYSRHLRNEMHGARTAKGRSVSRWYLADELDFLREHMATDTRPSPYSYTPTTFLEMDMSEQTPAADPVDIKPFIQNPWFSLSTAPRPFEVKQDYNDDSCSSAFDPDENSSYFQFFRGIYNDYCELAPRKQRQFKRQCLVFLHRLLDEQDNYVQDGREQDGREQDDVVNLSSGRSDDGDDRDHKMCILPNN